MNWKKELKKLKIGDKVDCSNNTYSFAPCSGTIVGIKGGLYKVEVEEYNPNSNAFNGKMIWLFTKNELTKR